MKYLFIFLVTLSVYTVAKAQTTISGSFISGGNTRTYRIYVPAIYNSSIAVPLVLNLHGYGSNNVQQEAYADFRPIADTANFIIVHPNGLDDGTGNLFWNAFGYPAPNDLGFLAALVDTIRSQYSIDDNAIYSTGMSNGGFMSYDLACGLSAKIAAIASVTGSMIPAHMSSCAPSHPLPTMQIHGTADATVPYAGSSSFVPIDSLVKHWVNFNNCSTTPLTTSVPNINTGDDCTATHYVYTGGNSGATVEFFKIQGGGHSWPGAPVNINTTCMDFSASKEIWRFFRQYRLNNLTGVKGNGTAIAKIVVYPNPSEGTFKIQFPDASKKTVRLLNRMGQVIWNYEVSALESEITVSDHGLYILQVQGVSGSFTQKIVCE